MRFLDVSLAFVLSLQIGAVAAQQNTSPPAQSTPPVVQAPSQTPDQQKGVEEYLKSKSGQNGKQEPSAGTEAAKEPTYDAPFVNGALNVPGAPKDSQTVPAKFSTRNDALDKLPIMALMLKLTEEQRQKILASVQRTNAPIQTLTAKVTEELPSTVELYDFSPALKSEVPGLNSLKHVRLANKILLVYSPNWIVVGEIETSVAK